MTPNDTYEAKTIVLAIGVSNSAMLTGETDLVGKGVCYCATCDGMLYRDKPVAVIAYTEEGEGERERDPGSRHRRAAGTGVGDEDVAVERDGPFGERRPVGDAAEGAADQA